MTKTPTMGSAMPLTRPPEAETETKKIPNAMATKKRRGKIGMSVYIDPVAHERVKAIAQSRNMTIEEFWIDAMNERLMKLGEGGIA